MGTDLGAGVLEANARAWRSLMEELDAWAMAGLSATLWWRYDDATEPSRALWRLRDITDGVGVPITLSVIPAAVRPGLVGLVEGWRGVTPVQHGFNHVNHAGSGAAKAEFTDKRPLSEMTADIAAGDRIMKALFGTGTLPVLVPPWNRMPAVVVTTLPELGFIGLSTHSVWDVMDNRGLCRLRVRTALGKALASLSVGFESSERRIRSGAPVASERRAITTVGATIDVIDWRAHRFLGESRVLDHATRHLRLRRNEGRIDIARPTGLLTHHGVMDEESWRFVERFAMATRYHPAVRWLTGSHVFGSLANRTCHGVVPARVDPQQPVLMTGGATVRSLDRRL